MCGVIGRVNAAADHRVRPEQLADGLRLMAHRGPDGEGLYLDENAGLGHRRLAILDLAGGAQPMCNEDRTIWVSFNGEIYNHQLLREELAGAGHRFATRSDTETLVHGYEQWGDELPTRLRGMFVFALWDVRKRRLLLARDRLGIKPLYFTRAGEDLVFASEIKALFAFPEVRCELNPSRAPDYFALRYVPGPETMFAGIQRLPPGHLLSWHDGAGKISRYWDVPVEAAEQRRRPRDEAEEAEVLAQQLRESVRMRLMAEVPVGLFLSGGIDSTAVAWAMKLAEPRALKSFSVGYEGDAEGELAWARLAARAIGTEHREVEVDSKSWLERLSELAWFLDEPLSDGACIPLMQLARRAREEVVVVLSGEGADEVFGGYPIYGKQLAIEQARGLGGPLLEGAARLALKAVRSPKPRRYLAMAGKPLERRYFGVGRAFDDELLVSAFGPRALEELIHRHERHWRRTAGCPPLERMLYLDTKVWLPDDLLIKADKMTMAWAIELRVPFLDHQLLESAWTLPPALKLRRGVGKHLLRVAMAGKVPEPILRRPKRGFPIPLGRWLQGPLYGPCRERLLSSHSAVREMLGARFIGGLLEEHRRGQADRREELYALWVFEEWHRTFLSRSREQLVQQPPRSRPELLGPAAGGAAALFGA